MIDNNLVSEIVFNIINNSKILCIKGNTAVGKTSLAVKIVGKLQEEGAKKIYYLTLAEDEKTIKEYFKRLKVKCNEDVVTIKDNYRYIDTISGLCIVETNIEYIIIDYVQLLKIKRIR